MCKDVKCVTREIISSVSIFVLPFPLLKSKYKRYRHRTLYSIVLLKVTCRHVLITESETSVRQGSEIRFQVLLTPLLLLMSSASLRF